MDPQIKERCMLKIEECISRTPLLQSLRQPKTVQQVIKIENNARGYTYEVIFGKYLCPEVREVIIKEPNMKKKIFKYSLLMTFLEVLLINCSRLEVIMLHTMGGSEALDDFFIGIKKWTFSPYRAKLKVEYCSTLCDSEVK